ncbi:MAG: GNAT family protein [Pseudomonadota bacterium]
MTHTNPLGQPIGAPVPGWTPPPKPGREVLAGRWVRLEPLVAETHGADLWRAFSANADGSDWTYRMQEPFRSEADLMAWLREIEAREDMLYFAYVSQETGQALGNGAFMTIAPTAGSIEVGSIMFSRAMQRTRMATEAMHLHMRWAFEAGYRRFEWTCDPLNQASMRAAARLGLSYEANFRQAYVSKGRNRDKAVFAATDQDWPGLKAAFETWLSPENFEAEAQKIALSALTSPLLAATAPEFQSARSNAFGQPIGADVPGWSPPPRPDDAVMEGQYCRLERLDPCHGPDLFEALSEDRDGRVFTYMPNGPFHDLEAYLAWLKAEAPCPDPLQFAILVEGRAVGTASFLRIDPGAGSIEVGYITFSPRLQQTTAATEAMFLMMQWAFEAGYRRYEWKCNAMNAPSRRAAERFGFSYEGIFRQAQIVKGQNRDTAWYAAIDSEWPALKAAFQTWLAPENFDPNGRQRQSLSQLTAPIPVAKGQ